MSYFGGYKDNLLLTMNIFLCITISPSDRYSKFHVNCTVSACNAFESKALPQGFIKPLRNLSQFMFYF